MPGKESPPPAPVVGQVICQMSRDEMKQLFEQSGYGSNVALFEAYFVKNSRPPLCSVCGNSIHLHTNDPRWEHREPAYDQGAQHETPDKTLFELQSLNAERAAEKDNEYPMPYAMPPHWRDSAYRVFSYYSIKEMAVVYRHNSKSPLVKAVWKCVAGSEGNPCEHTVKADGLQSTLGPRPNASTQCFKETEKWRVLEPTRAELDALEHHLRIAHDIDVDAVFDSAPDRRRWSTSLFDCTEHPRSCLDCLLCYPCGQPRCCPLLDLAVNEDCMILRLNKLTNHTAEKCGPCFFCQDYQPKVGFIVRGHNPSQCLCNWCDVVAYPLWSLLLFAGVWVATTPLVFATQLLTSFVTLCGLPCQNMPPALHNDCYQHRRFLVDQQGIPESHFGANSSHSAAGRAVSAKCGES